MKALLLAFSIGVFVGMLVFIFTPAEYKSVVAVVILALVGGVVVAASEWTP